MGNPEGSRCFPESGGGEWGGGGQEMSARGAWAGLGAAQGGGAEGQACAERGPELSSDPLSPLQKEHQVIGFYSLFR